MTGRKATFAALFDHLAKAQMFEFIQVPSGVFSQFVVDGGQNHSDRVHYTAQYVIDALQTVNGAVDYIHFMSNGI
jgi:hypothetical protein